MEQERSKEKTLRVLSIFVISIVSLVFVMIILFVNQRIEYRHLHIAKDGKLDISENTVYEEPIYLNGMWEYFEGTVIASEDELKILGEADQFESIPIGSITQATKSATYRLKFVLPKGEEENLLIYIPNFYKSADLYFNGEKLEYLKDGKPWLENSTLESVLPLKNVRSDQQWQELVITGDFKNMPITLYKRPITIGTMKNISALAMFSSSNELFLIGILMLVLINGYVFMLFRPGHRIISNMTLFDSMILMRSVCSMSYVMSFAKDIFPGITVSDKGSATGALLFLMLGGIVGCHLSVAIYDPENKAKFRWLTKPLPWIYGAFAIIFFISPIFFEQYGKYLLIIAYTATFVGMFFQFKICWSDKKRRPYNALQFIKTVYIGLLLLVDILLFDKATNFLLLFYLYSLFFILHIIVRLYDNNESYRDVEVLNTSLEDTVKERTRELYEANKILSALSIKDPLTQIFNRLHFENTLEEAIGEFKEGSQIYLAMFDLDFFKRINDEYGHDAGDEQLIFLSKLVNDIVGEKATFARLGGEEFVLLFVNVDGEEVMDCLEEIRTALTKDTLANKRHTTASFGVSSYNKGELGKRLLKRADVALYEAKGIGRNCIVINVEEKLIPVKRNIVG